MNYIGGRAENGRNSARDEETAEGARQLVFYTSRADLISSATASGIATRSPPATRSCGSREPPALFSVRERALRGLFIDRCRPALPRDRCSPSPRTRAFWTRQRNERTCLARQLCPWQVPDAVCETCPGLFPSPPGESRSLRRG